MKKEIEMRGHIENLYNFYYTRTAIVHFTSRFILFPIEDYRMDGLFSCLEENEKSARNLDKSRNLKEIL